ncbi:hypothetical protein L914_06004 [Phytophthora nicotianae]|uniref:Uncharacterized protein n=3 Tax=Phytophthora nicotianae TaxID=4792 RepID=V9FFG6_PHYNI|nr:hypothetical protein F443_06185 [Phytophthora nicotianae P1569]ETM49824.1 hypothetical protein L914_06005 [Phytophthora nicotianae]ETM49827.1 hypothetical protein L914_06004 [Phytophthora nicotianae]ETO78952.1 hypothetical protein F444_06246 [Phytophthora nicotianae P1976]
MDLGPDPPPLDHEGIIRFLLERMTDGKLPRGCINDAAAHFGCTRQTVSSVFHAKEKEPRESARGIGRVWIPDAIQEAVPAIKRTSYRVLAAATLGFLDPPSRVQRRTRTAFVELRGL